MPPALLVGQLADGGKQFVDPEPVAPRLEQRSLGDFPRETTPVGSGAGRDEGPLPMKAKRVYRKGT